MTLAHATERPSPFTVLEPAMKFIEEPKAEGRALRDMTIDDLIHNLALFADFYERASAAIERAEPIEKPWQFANREAHTHELIAQFRECRDIDRVRAYAYAQYSSDLTLTAAHRFKADVIRQGKLSVAHAGALLLTAALDLLDPPALPPKEKRGRGGRKPLTESTDPKDRAKLNAYRLIRGVWAKNLSWGEPELFDHFTRNKPGPLMAEVRSACARLDKAFIHAAVRWLKRHEPVHKTPAQNAP